MKKIYLLAISMTLAVILNAADKKVLVVSENLPGADATIQRLLDSINGMDGFKAEHMAMTDYGVLTADNFKTYAVALITENGSSGSMTQINNVGWPIPCINLKAYSLYQGTNPLFAQTGTNWTESPKVQVYDTMVGNIVVLDNSDILKCYTVGQSVKWVTGWNTTGGAGEAHVQGFDLLSAEANALVKSNAVALANNQYLAGQAGSVATNLWKIEESAYTKRIVCWGVHHTYMEFTTNHFFNILKNSIKWVLKMDIAGCAGPIGINNIESEKTYTLYPNPLKDKLYINNALSISNIDIIDITGKVVASQQNSNQPVIEINTSNLVNGLYMVRISDVNGNITSEKLIK